LIKAIRFSGSGDHCKKLKDAEVGGGVVSAIGSSSRGAGVGSTGGAFAILVGFVADDGAVDFGGVAARRSTTGEGGALRSGSGIVTKGDFWTGFAEN
jgi:hypothetical protein